MELSQRTITLRQGISAFASWRTVSHFLLCNLIGVKCSPYKYCPQTLIKQMTSDFPRWIFSLIVFWTLFQWDYFQTHSRLCPGSQSSITLWLLHALIHSDSVSVRSFWLQIRTWEPKGFNNRRALLAHITKKHRGEAGLEHGLLRVLLSFCFAFLA